MDRNAIKDAAQAHFSERRAELRQIEIPEWSSDGTASVYCRPALNVGEFIELARYVDSRTGKLDYEIFVQAFSKHALDENGTRLYAEHEASSIRERIDPEVLIQIVGKMGLLSGIVGGSLSNAPESTEKKSPSTAT